MTGRHPIDRRVAAARPDELDPATDPVRRERDLAAAFGTPPPHAPAAATRVQAGRSGRRVVVAAAGVAAVGVVVAVAAPYVVPQPADEPVRREAQQSPGPSASTGNPSTVRAMSARQALLGAAAVAGQLPAATGAYWHADGTYLTVHRVLEGGYLVESRQRNETWVAASPRQTSWWVSGHLGARAIDGGPGSDRTFWTAPVDVKCIDEKTKVDRPCLHTHRLEAKPGKASASPLNSGDKVFDLAGRNVSVADLRRLPSDPNRLRARLLATYEGHGTESDDPMDRTAWLFTVTAGMVTDMPVSPAVRAAAFRMLADMPGMRVIPDARDALGRTGTAVAMTGRYPGGAVLEDRLLLDLATGSALARESIVIVADEQRRGMPRGTRWHSQVIESAGWTDERPALPK
jgi:hypothetical protein